jgi:hypothetical protein
MHIELNVELISNGNAKSLLLLSGGYGTGHVVIQIDGEGAVENILTFIASRRADKAACWTDVGRFASCPVTLTLSRDLISIIIDSDVSVGNFGQSAGIYIPRGELDHLVTALGDALKKHRS